MTPEILGDSDPVARISESLAALGRGEPGAGLETARQDLARRRPTGSRRPRRPDRHDTRFRQPLRPGCRDGDRTARRL